MSAMPRNALNPTDSPVIIDDAGTQIDGKSTGKVDPGHPFVEAAIAAGTLLFATEADEPGEPDGQPTAEQLAAAQQLADGGGDKPPRTPRRGGAVAGPSQEA